MTLVCPSCGSRNPDGFRFCGSCGGELADQTPAEVRKTVTVAEDPDRSVLEALIMLRQGLLENAERSARASIERAGDLHVPIAADARLTLARILARQGRADEARADAEACLRRFEAKGIVPLIEQAHALLAELPR